MSSCFLVRIGQRNLLFIKRVVYNLLSISLLFGAFETIPNSAYNLALGNPIINVSGMGNGAFYDSGSLSKNRKIHFSGTVGNKFGLPELKESSWLIGLPYGQYNTGFGVRTFGNHLYQETVINFFGAGQLKNKLSWGCSINYYHIFIQDYGNTSTLGIGLSWRSNLSKNFTFVGLLNNINHPSLGKDQEALPQIISSGLLYRFENKIKAYLSWEQDIEYSGSIKFGCSYSPLPYLGFAIGGGSNPGITTAGFFISPSTFRIEYGIISYESIGRYSHKISISYFIPFSY
jgi:hypothetical protein